LTSRSWKQVFPTSLTIRRERRGRGRERPRLLSNLGCSPASVVSTRRSSLAWSCWAALPDGGTATASSICPTVKRHPPSESPRPWQPLK
jgi:hypothetical protein